MLNINGLGDDVLSAMMENAQANIVNKIMIAARNGRHDCTVKSKGTTPSFLAQLENEGISHILNDDDSIKLFWEF